jgi:Mg2+/Co2+ transporter CorC
MSNEARIAVEAALAVAEIVAQNEVVESQSFNQLVVYLHDAVEALAKEPAEPPHTIFPTLEAANDHLAGIEPAVDVAYRLSRSGDGKCVIQVFRLSGLL